MLTLKMKRLHQILTSSNKDKISDNRIKTSLKWKQVETSRGERKVGAVTGPGPAGPGNRRSAEIQEIKKRNQTQRPSKSLYQAISLKSKMVKLNRM